MPRKAQTTTITKITEADEPGTLPAGEAPELVDEPIIDETAEFLSQFGQDAKVIIYQIGRTGEKRYLATCEPLYFSEDWLQETYGEGRYILQVKVNARYRGQKQVSIGPPARVASGNSTAAPAPALNPVSSNDPADLRIQLLMQELSHQREIMMQILARPAEKTSMTELVEAMTALKSISAPASPASSLDSLMTILKTGIEIGKTGDVDTTKDEGFMGILKSALPIAGEVIKGFMPGANAPAVAAPGNPAPAAAAPAPAMNQEEIPGIEPQSLTLLRHGIAYLKQKALKGSSPDLYIDFILDSMDDPQWVPLVHLAQGSYEEFAKIDPDLLKAPYRTWFESLLKSIKEAFTVPELAGAEEKENGGTVTNIDAKRQAGN